jgi:ribonucrease Y
MLVALGLLIGLIAGGVLGAVAIRTIGASRFDKALRTRQQLLQEAEREAEAMRREARVEAREEAVKLRAGIEAENQERRAQLARIEERVE